MREIIIGVLLLLAEAAWTVAQSFRRCNPAFVEQKYDKHHEKIDELKRRMAPGTNGRDPLIRPKLVRLAEGFSWRADLAWGRDIRHQYRSAFFDVLAAEAYEVASYWHQAGAYFHYAGHTFRHAGEYYRAGEYYTRSADCYVQADRRDRAARSWRRAIAAYRQVHDVREAAELEQQLKELESDLSTGDKGSPV